MMFLCAITNLEMPGIPPRYSRVGMRGSNLVRLCIGISPYPCVTTVTM
jgi:hypothetical protein